MARRQAAHRCSAGEAPGNEEELGEGAVEIVEVRAEVLPAPGAPLADAAGREVGHHHPVARLPALFRAIIQGAHGGHAAGHFVAEGRGGLEHGGWPPR